MDQRNSSVDFIIAARGELVPQDPNDERGNAYYRQNRLSHTIPKSKLASQARFSWDDLPVLIQKFTIHSDCVAEFRSTKQHPILREVRRKA